MAKKAAKSRSKKDKEAVPAPGITKTPELHERIMMAGEASRLLNKSGLAVAYLVARDGMDEEMAASIVEGLGSDELHELVTEALTAPDPNVGKADPTDVTAEVGGKLVPGGKESDESKSDTEFVDLLTVDALLSDPDDVPAMIGKCIELSEHKRVSEAQYKEMKKRLIPKLDAAHTPNLMFGFIKLARYQGHTVTLSEQKLLEKGVSPDIIKQCWTDTPYEDIRFTVPKEPK